MQDERLEHPGNYIAGMFRPATSPITELVVRSPADLRDVVGRHAVSRADVDLAVDAATEAARVFRRAPRAAREALLRAYAERLAAHEEAIARTIAREAGKALWDARTEARAMVTKIALTIGEGATYAADRTLPDLPGEVRHRPHGVMAIVGPFNFPGHLPNGQIVPALLEGNSVVFKPSEKTPNTATWIARCAHEAGFPPGVFNLVQGDGAIAASLVGHMGVDAVAFTGSVAVGKKILAANVERPGRLIALELGGKNASIVLDDADVTRAVRQIAFAAFVSAGQRCTATSRVYVTRGVAERVVDGLVDAAKRARVGHVFAAGVFMGPMITRESREQLHAAIAKAERAGFEPLAPAGSVEVDGYDGHYARPSVHLAPSADARVDGYTHDELFGPDVAVYVVADEDEAIARANGTRYGLATAIFTEDRARFERIADELDTGLAHWNRSSAGASGRLPFGGVRESGNHRPAGIMASAFSAYPQARYLAPAKDEPLPKWPGLYDEP